VAVADDYCNIEDIRVGDLVCAWDEQAENLVLNPVEIIKKRTPTASYTSGLVTKK
jgi:hypothetical protein